VSIQADLDRLLDGFAGRFGLAAENLLTGERLERRGREQFDTASVIKLPILIEALRRVQVGELRLEQRLRMQASHYSEGSGVLKDLQPGVDLSLRDVCTLMVTVSDNVATNMLIDLLGIESVNATMRSLGAEQTVLLRRVSLDWSLGPLGLTTPFDCVTLLVGLERGTLLDAQRSAVALDILRRQQVSDFLNRYLPYDANRARLDPAGSLVIASKSGWTRQQRNDVGLVTAPGVRYAVALFAEGYPGLPRHPDHPPVLTLQRVSRAIYDHFVGAAGGGTP
jgi:beta-lactamase class A